MDLTTQQHQLRRCLYNTEVDLETLLIDWEDTKPPIRKERIRAIAENVQAVLLQIPAEQTYLVRPMVSIISQGLPFEEDEKRRLLETARAHLRIGLEQWEHFGRPSRSRFVGVREWLADILSAMEREEREE